MKIFGKNLCMTPYVNVASCAVRHRVHPIFSPPPYVYFFVPGLPKEASSERFSEPCLKMLWPNGSAGQVIMFMRSWVNPVRSAVTRLEDANFGMDTRTERAQATLSI